MKKIMRERSKYIKLTKLSVEGELKVEKICEICKKYFEKNDGTLVLRHKYLLEIKVLGQTLKLCNDCCDALANRIAYRGSQYMPNEGSVIGKTISSRMWVHKNMDMKNK